MTSHYLKRRHLNPPKPPHDGRRTVAKTKLQHTNTSCLLASPASSFLQCILLRGQNAPLTQQSSRVLACASLPSMHFCLLLMLHNVNKDLEMVRTDTLSSSVRHYLKIIETNWLLLFYKKISFCQCSDWAHLFDEMFNGSQTSTNTPYVVQTNHPLLNGQQHCSPV